ncbi:MAG TPA: hypothetical protein VHY56_12645 [Candidatus Binataceae bacterium]|nr:hypothetical protein [Candidatus Binataceae bacterium]
MGQVEPRRLVNDEQVEISNKWGWRPLTEHDRRYYPDTRFLRYFSHLLALVAATFKVSDLRVMRTVLHFSVFSTTQKLRLASRGNELPCRCRKPTHAFSGHQRIRMLGPVPLGSDLRPVCIINTAGEPLT